MRIAIFFSLLFIGHLVCGQNFLSWKFNDRYFSLSAGTGSVTYFGDLNPQHKISGRVKLSTLGIEARLLNHVSARIEGAYYTLQGSDSRAADGSFEQQRNLSFTSRNLEGNFQVLYYLKEYTGDYYSRWDWDPYIGVGVGITTYNPYTELLGKKYLLRPLATEPDKEYGKTTLVMPITAGIKFRVNDFANLIFELGFRYSTTDYLDDVSTTFPETYPNFTIEQLSNRRDEIKVVNQDAYDALVNGAQRGDNSSKDSYLFIGLKAEIFLPKNFLSGGNGGLKKSSVK
ncbi:MAG: hypothetical protein GY816_16225 [Cytophagales bacterium]|nr:hypothetical protein [Cytophagales bacterium]